MSGGVKLDGMGDLMRELTNAPDDIRHDAKDIVRETTESAASEIAHSYPSRTGTLRKRVATSYPSSAALVGVVKSRAPHSHLYEFGTRQRRTSRGANRGVMPAASPEVTVPIARKWRERMVTRLMAMLANKGFLVTSE